MNSPELLRLVEHCPTGAETLVTRVLHIVTDKSKLCAMTTGQLILAKEPVSARLRFKGFLRQVYSFRHSSRDSKVRIIQSKV